MIVYRLPLKVGLCLVFLLICKVVIADELNKSVEPVSFKTGEIGGWVMAGDHVTLIASRPATGELVYFDTAKREQQKVVEVDFAPNRLAIQGDKLYASVRGSSLIHSLDAKTGAVAARFKLPGETVEALACHPESGPVFAANTNEEVFVIDPANGTVKQTSARGTMLAVDPVGGRFLLTGTNQPGADFVEVQRDGRATRVRLVTVVNRAAVFRHAVEKDGLRPISGNTNAAFGDGGCLAISHDGSRFAMAAGGGWRSLTDQRFHYVVAVFETGDMATRVGQVELGAYPRAIAFHPVLNLGAVLRHRGTDVTIKLFKGSSLTDRDTFELHNQLPAPLKAHQLIFGGRGTTLVHYYRDTLTMFPLALSDDERASLDAAYHSSPRGENE